MKIKSIKLQNFKGWADFGFTFNENGKTVIYGKSGNGKTSILEAVKFVFGINSKDPYPQIKDELSGGVNYIRDLEVVVELLIEQNGYEYKLRRQANQKYKTNKETGEKEWAGWEASNFQIDGFAYTLTQFKEKITEMFRIEKHDYLEFLLDSTYFNSENAQKWTWKQRQEFLYSLMNVSGVLDEMINDERFALIKDYLEKGKTTNEILKLVNADKKSINELKEKNEILINEKTNELSQYSSYDFDELNKEREQLESQISIENELLSVQTNKTLELDIKIQIQDVQSKINSIIYEQQGKKNEINSKIVGDKNILANIERDIRTDENTLAELGKKWTHLNATNWNGDLECSLCKREFEKSNIEKQKEIFINEKENQMATIKESILQLRKQISNKKELYGNKLAEINKLNELIFEIAVNNALASHEEELNKLKIKLEELKNSVNSGLDFTKIDRLKELLRAVNEKLAFRLVKENLEVRLDLLKKEQLELFNREIINAKTRRALETYTLSIIEKVNNTVNSGFEGISWLLFNTLTAGSDNSISETCELIYNDTPYSSLSSGEKVQANFLTVKGILNNMKLEMPIFVDEVAISTGFERNHNSQVIEFKTVEGYDTNLIGVKIKDVYGDLK